MDKAKINEIIQYLKECLIKDGLKLDSIALFGSALNGDMHEDSDILSYVDVITPENEPYTKDDRCFEVYDNLTNPAIMLKTDW
jgi:predicted nucleotidyltransferase